MWSFHIDGGPTGSSEYALAFMIFFGAIGAYCMKKFLIRLEEHHSDVWSNLGKPDRRKGLSILGEFRLENFLLRRRYRGLCDQTLTNLGNLIWIILVVDLGLFLYLVV
jgi:hypothetical protein